MNRRGMTLMELLVYMAIVGIVVVVAGSAFTNSTKMRVRTQGMLQANQIAANIGTVIKDDVAQMGAKSSKEYTGAMESDGFSEVYSDVYMNPDATEASERDSSSFSITLDDDDQQVFTFRRLSYDEEGRYRSTEEVRWFLEEETLKRSCWTVMFRVGATVSEDDPCAKMKAEEAIPVTIAENVTHFQVIAGKPNVTVENIQMFPNHSGNEFMLVPRYGENFYHLLEANNQGSSTELSGFANNYDMGANRVQESANDPERVERNQLFVAEYENPFTLTPTSWKSVCNMDANKFTFVPNTTYEISFELPSTSRNNKMGMFIPDKDALSIGFRDASGNRPSQIQDFSFFPPVAEVYTAKQRSMRFSVGETVSDVCMVITFASLSPVATMGSITVENLKLTKVASSNYTFDPTWNSESVANIQDKKNVKAFKIDIGVSVGSEKGSVEQLILVPSNGPRD